MHINVDNSQTLWKSEKMHLKDCKMCDFIPVKFYKKQCCRSKDVARGSLGKEELALKEPGGLSGVMQMSCVLILVAVTDPRH